MGLRARLAAWGASWLLGLVGLPGCVGPGLEPPDSDALGAPDRGEDDSADAGVNGGVGAGAAGTSGGVPTSGASGGGGHTASGTGGGGNGGELSEPLDGGVPDGGIDEDAGALR